jgi:hypothetical protein
MEEEYIRLQEKNAIKSDVELKYLSFIFFFLFNNVFNRDSQSVEKMRGSPLNVGTLEEMIDENHAIVSEENTGLVCFYLFCVVIYFFIPFYFFFLLVLFVFINFINIRILCLSFVFCR